MGLLLIVYILEVIKINTDNIKFLTDKERKGKFGINCIIKSGQSLTSGDGSTVTDILGCPYLANLYLLIIDIKHGIMDSLIINDAPEYIFLMVNDVRVKDMFSTLSLMVQ